MNAYLSSVGIPQPERFRQLFSAPAARVAVVENAWDVAPIAKRQPFIRSLKAALHLVGCEPVTLDLRQFIGQPNALREQLWRCDGVWLTGGNTFYLNWLMAQTGFPLVLAEALQNGCVYGGESAGAVVAGTTLHGIEHLDVPNEAPETIWDGMGLIDFGIIPHWGEQKYAAYAEAARAEMAHYSTVYTLTNGQAFIIQDGNELELLGA